MHDNRNNNMDSLYEDNAVQFSATPQRQATKRPASLDLNGAAARQQAKRRLNNSVTTPAGFSSPDLQKLNVATPDLEQYIMNTQILQTPTAGAGIVFPSKVNNGFVFHLFNFLYSSRRSRSMRDLFWFLCLKKEGKKDFSMYRYRKY